VKTLLNALIWAIGLLIIFVLGGYQALANTPARFALQAISAVTLGVWALIALFRPTWRPNSGLLVPVLGLCVAYALSAVVSQRPRLSLDPALGGLAFAGGFFILSRLLQEDWLRARFAILVTTVAASIAVLYVIQVQVEWSQWWLTIGRPSVPPLRPAWAALSFASPNLVAAVLVLVGPLAVALTWSLTASRGVAWGLAVVIVMALLMTGSRAAYLGIAAGSAAGLGLLLAVSPQRLRLPIRRSTAVGLAAAGSIAGVVALPSVMHRLEQGGDTIRFDLWRSAGRIFMDFPLLGAGPGTWVQLKTAANEPGVPNPVFSNAHSMYFQTAAELGTVGIVASVIVVIALARLLVRAVRKSGGLALQSVGVVVGLVGFGVQAAFDTLTNLPMVCLVIIAVVAWVDAGMVPRVPSSPRRSLARLVPLAALAGILAFGPMLVRADLAAASALAGDRAALDGDWSTALDRYSDAAATDTDFTLYDIQTAAALARTGKLEEARTVLADAVRADPVAVNLVGLAALERDLGNAEGAIDLVRRAMLLGSGEPTVALNAGLIAESVGDLELALDQFAETVALVPELAESPLWDSPDRRVAKTAVIDAAIARTNPFTGAVLYAYVGRSVEALQLIQAQPPSETRDTYLAIVQWLTGDSRAGLAALEARLDDNALDWHAAAWIARLSRRAGDTAQAVRYGRWAIVVQSDVALSVVLEDEIDLGHTSPYAGLDRAYPTAVYLRPPSPFLLMPQLVAIHAP
jgi:O-antigen ligase/tetratricopeptide (TPR) repeat protein